MCERLTFALTSVTENKNKKRHHQGGFQEKITQRLVDRYEHMNMSVQIIDFIAIYNSMVETPASSVSFYKLNNF